YVCISCYIIIPSYFSVFNFFFFQAEDGIRDRNVTGVQTCALPISAYLKSLSEIDILFKTLFVKNKRNSNFKPFCSATSICHDKRSEERRVGKECRYRRRTQH